MATDSRERSALIVLIMTEKTRKFLIEHDPKAFAQALKALAANGYLSTAQLCQNAALDEVRGMIFQNHLLAKRIIENALDGV